MPVDPLAAAYLSGAAVLIIAEAVAVVAPRRGDTITEKTKRMPVTHAAMSSLLVWGSWHFVGEEFAPSPWPVHVAVAVGGAVAGLAAHRRRNAS
jgi:hypothetical protein